MSDKMLEEQERLLRYAGRLTIAIVLSTISALGFLGYALLDSPLFDLL